MVDLNHLYQEQILSYAREARQSKPIAHPDATAKMLNPSCGDEVAVALKLDGGKITQLSATTKGCAICEASTGFALGALIQMDEENALKLPQKVEDALTQEKDMPLSGGEAFHPIRAFKSRHTCVLLVYQAVAKAINDKRIVK